jgi:predicted amidophosphoribosyltransferase
MNMGIIVGKILVVKWVNSYIQLKYRNDKSLVVRIVDLLGKYKGLETMDVIIPIPSTKSRDFQPVNAMLNFQI